MQGHAIRLDEARISWGEAFVVVYSILSRSSFHAARTLIESLSKARASAYIPMMLLGNMTDLDDRRQVAVEEGHQVCKPMIKQLKFSVHSVKEIRRVLTRVFYFFTS